MPWALANEQRLHLLCLLVGSELTVDQINDLLHGLIQSALSQHLARLGDEGLVPNRREARSVWYTLPPGTSQAIIATLHGIYCTQIPMTRHTRAVGTRALHHWFGGARRDDPCSSA